MRCVKIGFMTSHLELGLKLGDDAVGEVKLGHEVLHHGRLLMGVVGGVEGGQEAAAAVGDAATAAEARL